MCSIIPSKVRPVLSAVRDAGGRAYLVGGAVRDVLLKIDAASKDLDFEVYHISIKKLIQTLSRFGAVETVGSSFAVIKLFMSRDLNIDFALPRRESKRGQGHRGFVISPDPDMPLEEACARRDFTINAMLMDPADGTIFDFFNGRSDLKRKILRHTSAHFDEDPLRPLRGMQFAARFDMTLHDETLKRCRAMAAEAETLPPERIFGEWEKWALSARFPDRGLSTLAAIGWDSLFGDLTALKDIDDGVKWRQTLKAVTQVASLAEEAAIDRPLRLVLMISALAHTLSASAAERLVDRLGTPGVLVKRIAPLLDALRDYQPEEKVRDATLLRLAARLAPERFRDFLKLLSCTRKAPPEKALSELAARAEALGVSDGPPVPLISGKILKSNGILPGPEMGRILREAFDAQLDRQFTTEAEAADWLAAYLSRDNVYPRKT